MPCHNARPLPPLYTFFRWGIGQRNEFTGLSGVPCKK